MKIISKRFVMGGGGGGGDFVFRSSIMIGDWDHLKWKMILIFNISLFIQ